MKILKVSDIRSADQETINAQGITSHELMERAATRCAEWISSRFPRTTKLCFFCGPGNNGGDGVSLAGIMNKQGYSCVIVLLNENEKSQKSHDLELSLNKIPENIQVFENEWNDVIITAEVLIDCIFGTGLKRSITGVFSNAIDSINKSGKYILSIDVPSGLPEYPEKPGKNDPVVKADHTLTFQSPKLSFLFPSSYRFCGSFSILDIGLDQQFIQSCISDFHFITKEDVAPLIPVRTKFNHKGNHGHGLLMTGSYGKGGAAILAANAAIHGGSGLVTVAGPDCNYISLQTSVPEAMFIKSGESFIHGHPHLGVYDGIAVGPGIGKETTVIDTLKSLIQNTPVPLILDADALNIISDNPTWLAFLPAFSILTPHPKEFARLTGKEEDDFKRLESAREFAKKNMVIVILKGAHSAVCSPDGKVYFNSSGNPGMAKGGTGDALTGLLLALICQGLPPLNAAITGVYLHGLAADLALEGTSEESLTATDIIKSFGKAFTFLKS